jgi:hypothetical protein
VFVDFGMVLGGGEMGTGNGSFGYWVVLKWLLAMDWGCGGLGTTGSAWVGRRGFGHGGSFSLMAR